MGCSPIKDEPKIIQIQSTLKQENKAEKQEDFSEYDLLLGHQIDNLSIKTEIFLSCKKLLKLTSNQNTFITVYRNEGSKWIEIGKTEVCKNTPNPSFIKSFAMNYHFEEDESSQKLKFQIDYTNKAEEITHVGNSIVTLKDILTSKNQELEKQIEGKRGKLIIKGIQKNSNSKYIQFKLGIKGKKLTKNKIVCKILKKKTNNELIPIYITEERDHITHKKDKTFYWSLVEFEQNRIENYGQISKIEENNEVKFQIFEVGKNDKPKLLTEVEILREELKIRREHQLKQVKNDFHFLLIEELAIVDKFTLFSFLVSGIEYQSFFFFDLTRSKYNYEKSLNLNNPLSRKLLLNPQVELIYRPYTDVKNKDKDKFLYVDVIKENIIQKNQKEAGEKDKAFLDFVNYNKEFKQNRKKREMLICLQNEKKDYINDDMTNLINSIVKDQFELDSDNRAACFGYGCNLVPDYDIMCNCVSMTMDIISPEVVGYQEVLNVYNKLISEAYLSGPPLVADTLSLFFNYVKDIEWTNDTQIYSVGFFIASGEIHDLTVLFNQLLIHSLLPCSIIVISIGSEFNSAEIEERLIDYKKTLGDGRLNMIYIDFHKITLSKDTSNYNNNLSDGDNHSDNNNKNSIDKTKLVCKMLYNRINEQFIDYINRTNRKPLDSENIQSKNTPNFFEYRQKKIKEKYSTPKVLNNERERLLKEIHTLKYSNAEFESTFNDKLPTFDRHYIINQLNKTKIKNLNEQNKRISKPKVLQREAEYILYKDGLVIDERHLITDNKNTDYEREEFERKSREAKEKAKQRSNDICNICKENPINVVFQDCKHLYCCIYCIMNISEEKCPICTKKITQYVRLYNQQ